MKAFPVEKLKPLGATLARDGFGDPCLTITFEPFSLPSPLEEGALMFAASLMASLDLPTMELAALQNQVFDFPINPVEGYIDASISFAGAHNPVDITRLEFGPLNGKQLTLTVLSQWLMSFEATGFADFDLSFSVELSTV